ncbi:MAG: hypothetical protein QXH92_04555 [Candidatus Aenigmatarchaeota archaeon]
MPNNENVQEGFNEMEFLQSLWIKIHNRDVRECFKDEEEGDIADLINVRPAVKYACLLKDNDSLPVMIFKTLFFYLILRKAQDLQLPVIGMPINQYEETTKYRPIISLYFKQPTIETQPGRTPIGAQISIRLVNETSTSITKAELVKIARKIKQEFLPGDNPYEWTKGRKLVSYRDQEHGLRLRLYVQRETEAKEIIRKVCSIIDAPFEESLMTISTSANPSEAFSSVPKTIRILGENFLEPRKRPIGTVRFAYALCKIWGRNKPVVLCQSFSYFRHCLIE